MNAQIRVAIVDDHAIIRQGLNTLLTASGLQVIGEAECGDSAVQLAREQKPDVLLLDIRMKGCDGLTALPHIKSASPNTEVIMLTTYSNPVYMQQAIKQGASGFLLKDSDPEDIVKAIFTAASHYYLFDRTLLTTVVDMNGKTITDDGGMTSTTGDYLENTASYKEPSLEPAEIRPEDAPDIGMPVDVITEREQDVLRLMAKGMANAEIAATLQLSITTVKTHVSHILRKLSVNDRTQAVLCAYRHGLL